MIARDTIDTRRSKTRNRLVDVYETDPTHLHWGSLQNEEIPFHSSKGGTGSEPVGRQWLYTFINLLYTAPALALSMTASAAKRACER